jgi:hypothetical protein
VKLSRVGFVLFVLGCGVAAAVPAHAKHIRVRPSVHLHWGHHGWGHGWGWWGGYPSFAPGWGYTTVYPNAAYGGYGALDLDLSPERAEVWVDGRKVGLADDFDGFPELLWLEKGTYDVVFYLPGHRTLARQYTIYPGLIVDVEDRLEPGEATHPLELGPRTHTRRDERLRVEREIREDVERRRRSGELPDPDADDRYRRDEEESSSDREPLEVRPDDALDARSEPGRLVLRVRPDDASVYLDGRFLGTGRELAGLRSGLIVDPGEHRLEIVRPGRQAAERTVEVESGRELEVAIELDED